MTKHTLRTHAQIFVPVLSVLMCLLPLLSCSIIGRESSTSETEGPLWGLTNPKRSFNAFLIPDSLDYDLEDTLSLQLRATNDAHIIIFNWNANGELRVLLPSTHQAESTIKAGTTYTFPQADADFNIPLSGPVGTERFKVIALRNPDDITAVTDLFPKENAIFQQVSGTQQMEIEKKIAKHLQGIDAKDWTEDSQSVEVHASTLSTDPPSALQPVIPEVFFQPPSSEKDVIIDAGPLGRYRFSGTTEMPDVPLHIVRQELVDLLNELQRTLKQPIQITAGYRSRQHQIYLWAMWLSEHPEHIATLNQQSHPTWEAWVEASQTLQGCPSLQSKHQTGEAVDFYWETLNADSDAQRIAQIREAGGTRDYTDEERQRFSIPDDDNALFAVTAQPAGTAGRTTFQVVYQPSKMPAMPNIDRIGTLLKPSEPPPETEDLLTLTNPESSFTVSLKTDSPTYTVGDLLELEIQSTEDAYITVLNENSAGTLSILFPNAYDRRNRLRAGRAYAIPDKDSDFEFYLDRPGVERLKVIAFSSRRYSEGFTRLFKTELNAESQPFWYWEGSNIQKTEKLIIDYLHQIDPAEWAEDNLAIGVRETDDTQQQPNVIPPDYKLGDIVYIKDGKNRYFGEVTAEVAEDAEEVAVDIFNEDIRKKLGDTVSAELVIGRRAEPPSGWGIHKVMLSFYRDGKWTFTTDVVVFEDHYLLPARIDGEPVQGSRKVGLGEVRIPIPVTFPSTD